MATRLGLHTLGCTNVSTRTRHTWHARFGGAPKPEEAEGDGAAAAAAAAAPALLAANAGGSHAGVKREEDA